MGRSLLHRIHNPHDHMCACDPDCWCRRTALGRVVKWWFPAHWFGIRHKTTSVDRTTGDELRAWKREQDRTRRPHPMIAQPKYEKIVRLGQRRWGFTVRQCDGSVVVHEVLGYARLDHSG